MAGSKSDVVVEATKSCSRCLRDLPVSDFHKRSNRASGLTSWCKTCDVTRKGTPERQAELRKAHYEANREEYLARERQRRVGVTAEEYARMLAEQEGCCGICGREETCLNRRGEVRELAVDHDHVTGQVRGLLCHNCNAGIGLLAENVETLMAAVAYLMQHNTGGESDSGF